MKKYLFLLLLLSAVSANAQTFDEADLIGTWNTVGLAYAPYKITNIESITLGDGWYESEKAYKKSCWSGFFKNLTRVNYNNGEEETRTYEQEQINDFFISNNNKLHIVQESMTLHFIIEELTPTTLKVKTYDGQSYSFTKDNSSVGVRSLSMTRSADGSTYNLSGHRVENVTANGIYIQNGQKMVMKK
jgi:hypothetical protein